MGIIDTEGIDTMKEATELKEIRAMEEYEVYKSLELESE